MDSKLSLKLNAVVLQRAKKLAAKKKISLSRMVEAYLYSITTSESNEMEIVKSITNGSKIPTELTKRRISEEYLKYQQEKHQ